jgi:regulator of RNase E activity RraA
MQATREQLAALAEVDTPTICNALEVIDPAWRTAGFTTRPFTVLDPTLRPIVGVARTATIRATTLPDQDEAAGRARRLRWYERVAARDLPTVAVIHDLDPQPGFGAFWGEVQTHVHRGLGCLGGITDGSIRDLDAAAAGFQLLAGSVGPSHAHVHLVEMGVVVEVHGMTVRDGDLIHADRHGAVVIPPHALQALPATIDRLARKEAVILDAARAPGFDLDQLKAAMERAASLT